MAEFRLLIGLLERDLDDPQWPGGRGRHHRHLPEELLALGDEWISSSVPAFSTLVGRLAPQLMDQGPADIVTFLNYLDIRVVFEKA